MTTAVFLSSARQETDLFGTLDGDEFGVDVLGLEDHLLGVLELLVLLDGDPELDVLVAELALQEQPEEIHPV